MGKKNMQDLYFFPCRVSGKLPSFTNSLTLEKEESIVFTDLLIMSNHN